jgi:hypothetical protein
MYLDLPLGLVIMYFTNFLTSMESIDIILKLFVIFDKKSQGIIAIYFIRIAFHMFIIIDYFS